jgi:ATP-binding cassette subfamily B protein
MSTERQAPADLALMRRALVMARPYWPHIVATFLITLVATPIALLQPLPLKIAVDSVIGDDALPGFLEPWVPRAFSSSTLGLLVFSAALVVLVELLARLHKLVTAVLQIYTSERLVLDVRSQLFRHAEGLSLSYHDARGSADALYRLQSDAPSINAIALGGVVPLIRSIVTSIAMLYVTARIDLTLTLVAVTVFPVTLMVTLIAKRRFRSRWRGVKEIESSALAVAQEVLTSLRVVKAFGQEERERRRFERVSQQGIGARIRVHIAHSGFSILAGLIRAGGTAAVLFLGVLHVLDGTLTLGSLLLVMSYLAQLYGPLLALGQQFTALQRSFASAERVFEFLDREPDVQEAPNPRRLERARGAFVFDGVSFSYGEETVLDGFELSVPAGARVGVAGRTGAGKTTLMNLLARFYDPTSGRILLDDVDIREFKVSDLRGQFGIVLQEPVLFSTTVAENIAYGCPTASRSEIVGAARAANVHDFLEGLPNGYETEVGERGMRMSGGERQRIALARAFLRDAPILILDEPTSSVDIETESSIMEAMQRLMRGRTTFLIAHRLQTLEACDLLLVMDGGRLISVTTKVEEALGAVQQAGALDAATEADGQP